MNDVSNPKIGLDNDGLLMVMVWVYGVYCESKDTGSVSVMEFKSVAVDMGICGTGSQKKSSSLRAKP